MTNIWVTRIALLVLLVQGALAVPVWRESRGFHGSLPSNGNCHTAATNHKTKIWHDDVLGDLVLDDSWYVGTRPLNFCPHSRASIDTKFILHTHQEPGEFTDTYLVANKDVIDATTFDPSKPIKIITHGFIDTGNIGWLKTFARSMLRYGEYNVIRVDWGGGSLPLYGQATANTRVVGLEVAYLVNFFVDNYGVDPANVHILGHSLGSHVSGYAGERIPGLGRITGLDPAGPYFTATPAFMRLDHTDAVFVDCIHTDAKTILLLGYGSEQPMGNLDFYPNAGYNQPGCSPVTIGIQFIISIPGGVRDLVACSHDRSIDLFIDSVDQVCPFVGHECVDYDTFENGRCAECKDDNSRCALMGIRAQEYEHKDRVNVQMYFDTDKKTPFCYFHYQVVVDLAHPKKAPDEVKGHLDVWMYGDNGEVILEYRLTKRVEHFEHGQPKYFLLKSHTDLSRVIRMEVKWDYEMFLSEEEKQQQQKEEESSEEDDEKLVGLFNHKLYVRSFHVSPMDHATEEERVDHTRTLCEVGKEYTAIESGQTKSFVSDDSCVFGL